MQSAPELELVLKAQTGDRESFGMLVVRYQNLVTSIALSRTGNLQASEDVAQQAFLIAWQRLGELDEPAKFGAWLRTIVRHTAWNSNRKGSMHHSTSRSLGPGDQPATTSTPEEVASLGEQQALLWECLESMPEQYREPLVLYYRQERSTADVASLLDLSVDTVKKRLSRGRALIKEEARDFVEEILGASKPGTSFSSAVVAALPVLAAHEIARGTAAAAAKKAAAKVTSAASNWNMWIGLFGLIYGMGAAEKNVGATIVKNQLFWFAKIATFVTAILLTVALAASAIGGPSLDHALFLAGAIYGALLVVSGAFFLLRQRKLDRLHGPTRAKFEVFDLEPATPKDFKKAISGATLSSWAWLLFAAYGSADYYTLGFASLTMWTVNALRRSQSTRVLTIPGQMRFQSTNFLAHVVLSSAIFWVAGWLGRPVQVLHQPHWQVCALVLAVGLTTVASTRRAANKFEARLAGA